MRPYVAVHFDDAEQRQEASALGMSVFLVDDHVLRRTVYGQVYTVYRASYPDAFAAASHHLDVTLGTINTAVLIGGGLTMALAVHSAQLGKRRPLILFLLLTIVLGSVFSGYERSVRCTSFTNCACQARIFTGPDQTRVTQIFYSMYFAMTGMHALHMVIEIVILAILVWNSARNQYGPTCHSG